MDPLLFKQQLSPLCDHEKYDINEILQICYPLRGVWDWSMIDGSNNAITRIFKMVHLNQQDYLKVEPDWITETFIKKGNSVIEYDERWGICWDKNIDLRTTHLYKSLEDLLELSEHSNTPDWDDYGTSSDDSSDEVTVSLTESTSVKEIEFSTIERDQTWRDNNPAFNPRFIEDLEKGYIDPPAGFTIEDTVSVIKGIQELEDEEFLAADASGEKGGAGLSEFGLYGKTRCMKSVKMVRFFEQHVDEYSLDIDVTQWVEKAEKRTNIWKWIRVGPGFYRDFDWMFLGDRDCITKTINVLVDMGYKPLLEKRIPGHTFDFDPTEIFKLSIGRGKCLNIDTGEAVISKNADLYGFISKDMSKKRVQKIRGYIFDYFVKQYPDRWIPGKKNRWAKQFFESLKEGAYINFETLKPIKYSATTNATYHFSKLGFAISKDEKNFSVRDVEKAIKEYKLIKKN